MIFAQRRNGLCDKIIAALFTVSIFHNTFSKKVWKMFFSFKISWKIWSMNYSNAFIPLAWSKGIQKSSLLIKASSKTGAKMVRPGDLRASSQLPGLNTFLNPFFHCFFKRTGLKIILIWHLSKNSHPYFDSVRGDETVAWQLMCEEGRDDFCVEA